MNSYTCQAPTRHLSGHPGDLDGSFQLILRNKAPGAVAGQEW